MAASGHETRNLSISDHSLLSHIDPSLHAEVLRSGILDLPMSHLREFVSCGPSVNIQRPSIRHGSFDDQDHSGGVPLTPAAIGLSPENRDELVQDGRVFESFTIDAAEPILTTSDLIEGGVWLSADLNTENVCEDTFVEMASPGSVDSELGIQSYQPTIPGSQAPANYFDEALARLPLPSPPVQIDHNFHVLLESQGQTTSVTPSSPTEASSTRWPGTETTRTAYELRLTQEFNFEIYSWVEYDVVGFLDRWDIQYDMGEAGLMHVNQERKHQWLSPDKNLATSMQDECRDIQGLDWSALKTNRTKARMARKMLYPLSYSSNPRADQDQFGYEQQHMYAFKDFYPQHKAQYSHGQLRHVLAARGRNDIFYATKNKVMHTSLTCPYSADAIIDLSGASTNPNRTAGDCLVTTIDVSPLSDFEGYVSDAILVAGGYGGEYAMLNLNSEIGEAATEGFVTHAHESITTHVHTLSHRRTGALGAAFCSNDRKLRLLDVGTNTWTAEFEYANEINCAVTSPDGRLRAVVGDMCETLITDADRGDVLLSTRQHTGFGFACAWASDGWHVATGSEDGKVVVYDARKWDAPLTVLSCDMSCARSLYFTTSNRGSPALVVAESDDIVSVYDADNWHDRQTMEFFGSIVGAACLDDGQELIVANGDRTVGGLMVFDRQEDIHVEPKAASRNAEFDNSWQPQSRKSRKRGTAEEDDLENHPKRFGLGLDLDDLIL